MALKSRTYLADLPVFAILSQTWRRKWCRHRIPLRHRYRKGIHYWHHFRRHATNNRKSWQITDISEDELQGEILTIMQDVFKIGLARKSLCVKNNKAFSLGYSLKRSLLRKNAVLMCLKSFHCFRCGELLPLLLHGPLIKW